MSKGGKVEQFHERKTRTFSSEEIGGLDRPDGSREGHSLVDRVYKRKNLEIAWERVQANQEDANFGYRRGRSTKDALQSVEGD